MNTIIQKYFNNSDLRFVLSLLLIYVIYIFILSLTSFFSIIPTSISFIVSNSYFILITATEEEAVWRFVPLVIALENNVNTKMLIVVSISSSIVFGLIHGAYLDILTCGFFGLIMCIIFICLNKKKKRYATSFIALCILHALYNFASSYNYLAN